MLTPSGYRRVLNLEDLHSLGSELSSNDLRGSFRHAWIQRQDNGGRYAIYQTVWKVLRSDIMLPFIPRMVYMGTTLAQPFLITAMITFIENARKVGTQNDGYGLIAVFAFNYTLMAVCNSWYAQSMARCSTKLRSGLVSLVYHHTLQIHPKDADVGAGTVLMNVDVEKVLEGSTFFHEFWAGFISCGIALYMLYTHLGISFVVPTVTSIAMAVACFQIGKLMKPRQSRWTAATQKRVTAISYATGSMKAIRMLGLTGTVHNDLARLREEEVDTQR
jgi:ATP-binding cassette, subfamily C (CFTR/MRP), member 1